MGIIITAIVVGAAVYTRTTLKAVGASISMLSKYLPSS
jgi:hypothetical protein